MWTGLAFIALGVIILLYPQVLIAMISGFLIVFGLGMMIASWQFRRFQRRSQSRFVNWIIRY